MLVTSQTLQLTERDNVIKELRRQLAETESKLWSTQDQLQECLQMTSEPYGPQ